MKILLIEDEVKLSAYLRKGLGEAGYSVDVVHNGVDGLHMALEGSHDLVILDAMLPGIDGFTVLTALRKTKQTPVLMLTAKDTTADRVQGLDAGADDYLVKPFEIEELSARVRALLRRTQPERATVLTFADLTLDTSTRQAMRRGRVISLTAKEYDLLELFMRHPRQVLTRELIFDRVWGYDFGGESNVLDVYIRYLRQKLEAEGEDRLLHTQRGVGYVLRENP